jgi:molybdenum cofactor cytidylyltransferase
MPILTEHTLPTIALIVLAAGASSRMGTPKQLLKFKGVSLVRHAALTGLESGCSPVLVVLGASKELIRPELEDLPLHILENLEWEKGMSTSIRTGINYLLQTVPPISAALLMLCDQPMVSSVLIKQLMNECQTSSAPFIACEYGNQWGVPALFSRELFAELLDLKGMAGAKDVIRKYAEKGQSVTFPEGLIDVDTPEDYQRLQTDGSDKMPK